MLTHQRAHRNERTTQHIWAMPQEAGHSVLAGLHRRRAALAMRASLGTQSPMAGEPLASWWALAATRHVSGRAARDVSGHSRGMPGREGAEEEDEEEGSKRWWG